MAITKREFSTYDAAVSVLYAKRNADDTVAYPILVSSKGAFQLSQGMFVPEHDTQVIDESDPNNVTVTYKLSGVTVATKTIAISGSTTTISISY